MRHRYEHHFSRAVHPQREPGADTDRHEQPRITGLVETGASLVGERHVRIGLVSSCDLTSMGMTRERQRNTDTGGMIEPLWIVAKQKMR